MEEFAQDMASQRLDSVEGEMEEFFDVNALDDVDDDNPRPGQDGKIDFYNRRDSKAQPNQKMQSMNDKVREQEFLDKKLKP